MLLLMLAFFIFNGGVFVGFVMIGVCKRMLKSMSSDLVRFGKICAFMDEFGKF